MKGVIYYQIHMKTIRYVNMESNRIKIISSDRYNKRELIRQYGIQPHQNHQLREV